MTTLHRNALATLPLSVSDVEDIYKKARQIPVQKICESHERLRLEMEGSELLLSDAEKEVAALKTLLKAIVDADDDLAPSVNGLPDAIDNARIMLKGST